MFVILRPRLPYLRTDNLRKGIIALCMLDTFCCCLRRCATATHTKTFTRCHTNKPCLAIKWRENTNEVGLPQYYTIAPINWPTLPWFWRLTISLKRHWNRKRESYGKGFLWFCWWNLSGHTSQGTHLIFSWWTLGCGIEAHPRKNLHAMFCHNASVA